MLANVRPEDILFLDIETIPASPSWEEMDPIFQKHWERKSKQFRTEEQTPGEVYERAGIYSEFGRIICISVGMIREKNPFAFRLKSFYGDNEKEILSEFSAMLEKFTKNREAQLCAHNGREFDYPYIARRMIINGLIIPEILDNAGKKPWEVRLLDTVDLWKFGDYKNFTSLNLLAHVLGIPTPKDDIDGSMVQSVYYEERNLPRIVHYCQKDVLTVAQVYLRLSGEQLIKPEAVDVK